MASKVHNESHMSRVTRIFDPSHGDLSVSWVKFWALYLTNPEVGNLHRRFFCYLEVVMR